MRHVVTLLMAAVLLSMITVMPLISCPFLKPETQACCSRTTKCPLSKTVETCPFYVTETKIGIKVAKFAIDGLPVSSAAFTPVAFSAPPVERIVPLASSDLYLLHRVLLI
jgi:hypothetical protein